MGQNIIELGFNIDELTAEKKIVLDLFIDMFGQLKQYDGTRFNPLGKGGLADLKKSLTDGAQAMAAFQQTAQKYNETITAQYQKQQATKKSTDDLTLSEKLHLKNLQDTVAAKAKFSEADTNAANDRAIEIQRLKSLTAEVNANAKAYLSEIGSVKEAKATISQLTIERDKQNATTSEGKERIRELNEAIDKNNNFIKANVSELEKQKINIGNYPQIIGILESSLAGLNSRLDAMAAAGDQGSEAFQRLTLEQKILQGTLDRQSEGFSNVNQALRSTKNALDAMTLAGLQNSEAFEKLNIAYTEAEQKVKDLHREQAILTTDAPALTALTGIAKGLGGAYALGAGAAGIFASGNEKLDKELNKLVAVMTFLQGLNEAVAALKERNAIATALETEATKALAVVKRIEIAIFGTSATVTKEEAEAKLISAEATAINTEASEANTVGAEVNAIAVEGVAAANVAATGATIAFRTALISTGIGAIIIGIIYGITKLVGAISDWINSDERVEKAQAAVAESTSKLIETFKELKEVYDTIGKERIEQLTRESALQKDAGKNQFIQLAAEQQINDKRLELSKRFVEQRGIDEKKVSELYEQQKFDLETLYGFEKSLQSAQAELGKDDSSANKNRVESLEKLRDQAEKTAKNSTGLYKIASDAYKAFVNDQNAADDTRVKTAKAAADELAKLTADAAQRRYDIAKDANDRILSLDTSTEEQRIAANRGNFDADAALANSKIEAVKKEIAARTITEKDGANDIANIQTDLSLKYKKFLDDRLKIQIEYRDRSLQANASIYKNNNESDAAIQEAITKDLQKELEDRLGALKRNIDDRTAIINNDYRTQLTLAKEHGKTQEEIDQLDSDRQKALLELTANVQKEIYDITISYGEKKLKAIQDQNKTIDSAAGVTEKYNAETEALNDQLLNRNISYSHYLNEKRKLDQKYILDKDAADIADDERKLKEVRDYEQKKLGIELLFAEKSLDRAKIGGNDKEIADAQAKYDALREIQTKSAAEEVAINDKLNKDKQKQNNDKVKPTVDALQTLHDKEKELAEDSFNLAKTLVDSSYENRINQIQHLMEVEDQQTEQEIAAVQRSTLSQQDQAAEVIILAAQQKARDTELKRQEKQEKIKEAKFDREMAVAKVVWDTSLAEIAAIAQYGGTPYGFAIAAVIAALGAVSIATILAKPIPSYGDGIGIPGKGQHPGGEALVGERYKPELVSMPGKDPFIVDKPTLLNLDAGSSVLPLDPKTIVFDIGAAGLLWGASLINNQPEKDNQAWDVARWQTAQMKKALSKTNRKIQNIVHVHVDTGWERYLDKKVRGKG